jgi:hypothetical protein
MLERNGCSRFSGEFKVHKLEELYDTSLAQEKRVTQFTIFYLPVPYTKNLRCVFVKVQNSLFIFIFLSWNVYDFTVQELKIEKHTQVVSTDCTDRTGSDSH